MVVSVEDSECVHVLIVGRRWQHSLGLATRLATCDTLEIATH